MCARTRFIISSSLAAPWTIEYEVPLSVGFSRQEYWRGLPFLPLGDLPDLGIKPTSLVSPVLAGGFFTTEPPGKPSPWVEARDASTEKNKVEPLRLEFGVFLKWDNLGLQWTSD